ncbi:MAG: hypothetical protein HC884_06215 [Chloroflexaceae bacterium]|nr:hypothetical protein [Chloroflexaceae bacterium]
MFETPHPFIPLMCFVQDDMVMLLAGARGKEEKVCTVFWPESVSNRAVVKSLGKNVIAEVRPREVPSSQYLMDPLIDKVPELGKDKEFW